MNLKYVIWVAMTLGLIFIAGCGTPDTSNKPWDKPIQVSGSSFDSPYAFRSAN
jgi:hypothetical protein